MRIMAFDPLFAGIFQSFSEILPEYTHCPNIKGNSALLFSLDLQDQHLFSKNFTPLIQTTPYLADPVP